MAHRCDGFSEGSAVTFPKTGSNVIRNQFLGYKDLKAVEIGASDGAVSLGNEGGRRLEGDDKQKSRRKDRVQEDEESMTDDQTSVYDNRNDRKYDKNDGIDSVVQNRNDKNDEKDEFDSQ